MLYSRFLDIEYYTIWVCWRDAQFFGHWEAYWSRIMYRCVLYNMIVIVIVDGQNLRLSTQKMPQVIVHMYACSCISVPVFLSPSHTLLPISTLFLSSTTVYFSLLPVSGSIPSVGSSLDSHMRLMFHETAGKSCITVSCVLVCVVPWLNVCVCAGKTSGITVCPRLSRASFQAPAAYAIWLKCVTFSNALESKYGPCMFIHLDFLLGSCHSRFPARRLFCLIGGLAQPPTGVHARWLHFSLFGHIRSRRGNAHFVSWRCS